jgi:hypothetical protein
VINQQTAFYNAVAREINSGVWAVDALANWLEDLDLPPPDG